MNERIVGSMLIAGGAVLVALSALSDVIGIGADEGFGWKQLLGISVGVAAIVVGAGLMYRYRDEQNKLRVARRTTADLEG
jgi:hypothetical protein